MEIDFAGCYLPRSIKFSIRSRVLLCPRIVGTTMEARARHKAKSPPTSGRRPHATRDRVGSGDDQVGLEQSLAALNGVRGGVVLLDPEARIWFTHVEARRILQAADGLFIESATLTARSQRCARKLSDALRRRTALPFARPVILLVERTSNRRPYQLSVQFIGRNLDCDRPGLIVTIVDPEQTLAVSTDLLSLVFGLTSAEGALARALAGGTDLSQYARKARITMNTARGHLKKIFEKTNTHRQGELIALLLRSCLL